MCQKINKLLEQYEQALRSKTQDKVKRIETRLRQSRDGYIRQSKGVTEFLKIHSSDNLSDQQKKEITDSIKPSMIRLLNTMIETLRYKTLID